METGGRQGGAHDDRPTADRGGPRGLTRAGAGLVDIADADAPLVRPSPTGVSFGLVHTETTVSRSVALGDAGGGAGPWTVTFDSSGAPQGTQLGLPPTVTVPGTLALDLVAGDATGEIAGVIVLHRGTVARRVPVWGRVERPALSLAGARTLARTGTYTGDTARGSTRVAAYRYPDDPGGAGLHDQPSRPRAGVPRPQLAKPVANFGVVVTKGTVEPRVVFAGDENRLVGYPGLPLNINPYGESYGKPAGRRGRAAGGRRLRRRLRRGGSRKPFTFRYWVDDTRPPTVKLLTRTVAAAASRCSGHRRGSRHRPVH